MDPFSYEEGTIFQLAKLDRLSVEAIFVSMALGFCLSLLFFMDQNISAAMVASPENKYVSFYVTFKCIIVVAE